MLLLLPASAPKTTTSSLARVIILHRRRLGTQRSSSSPLGGVRVIDLTSGLCGPFASMLLGDLGADIIKVEKPQSGDPSRRWPPFVESPEGPQSTIFLALNRNKRSVTADLTSEEGAALAKELVKSADVVLTDFLPKKAAELGLEFKNLKKLNPQILHCSITGYGNTGPYKDFPSYDGTIAAEAGIMYCTGEPDRDPVRPQVTPTANTGAYYAISAVMAGLISRDLTGKGAFIDVSTFDTQLSSLGSIGAAWLNGRQEYKRVGTSHPTMVPYQTFSTSDGSLTIGTGNDLQFSKVCSAMGVPALSKDPRYATNNLRVTNRATLIPTMAAILKEETTKYWIENFKGKGFPTGAINNMEETFSHPQVEARGLLAEIPHPTIGTSKMVRPAVLYNGERMKIRSAAPLLGQHTDEVLSKDLALSTDRIQELRIAGFI